MHRATPLVEKRPKSKRYEPVVKYWAEIKHAANKFSALCPHVHPEWKIEYKGPRPTVSRKPS